LLTARAGTQIWLLTPIPWPNQSEKHPVEFALEQYRKILLECAAEFPAVRVVDGFELLENDNRYFADGVHPDARGMERMAERLFRRFTAAGAES